MQIYSYRDLDNKIDNSYNMCNSDSPVNKHLKGFDSLECLVKIAVCLDGWPGEADEEWVQCFLKPGDMWHQQGGQTLTNLVQHSGVFIQQMLQMKPSIFVFSSSTRW